MKYVVANVGQPQPSRFGGAFDGPMAGLSPGMPEHCDRHVWTWQANPDEIFVRWNTAARRGS